MNDLLLPFRALENSSGDVDQCLPWVQGLSLPVGLDLLLLLSLEPDLSLLV